MTVPVDITDPRIAKAYAHPLRIHILGMLDDRVASPSEIAGEIGAPLTHVSYHVRQLAGLGLIKLVKTTPRRRAARERRHQAPPAAARQGQGLGTAPPYRERATRVARSATWEESGLRSRRARLRAVTRLNTCNGRHAKGKLRVRVGLCPRVR